MREQDLPRHGHQREPNGQRYERAPAEFDDEHQARESDQLCANRKYRLHAER
jgi:hypothetical protein